MATQVLTKAKEKAPSIFDDFFKPWNEWFNNSNSWNRFVTIPPVNITENKGAYLVTLAVPGMKKDDFKIDVDGNMLTISSEKEERKDEGDKKYTRQEYSYSSFSRSFSLPEEVNKEKIDARYDNGILTLTLPVRETAKKN